MITAPARRRRSMRTPKAPDDRLKPDGRRRQWARLRVNRPGVHGVFRLATMAVHQGRSRSNRRGGDDRSFGGGARHRQACFARLVACQGIPGRALGRHDHAVRRRRRRHGVARGSRVLAEHGGPSHRGAGAAPLAQALVRQSDRTRPRPFRFAAHRRRHALHDRWGRTAGDLLRPVPAANLCRPVHARRHLRVGRLS